MLPRLEILSRRKNDDLAPSGLAIGLRPRVDRDSLGGPERLGAGEVAVLAEQVGDDLTLIGGKVEQRRAGRNGRAAEQPCLQLRAGWAMGRSEEHTSELQSLMRISYAVFCLKKKT